MKRARQLPWPALVVLPVLVGALLLMHGLEGAAASAHPTAVQKASHAHAASDGGALAGDRAPAAAAALPADAGEQRCEQCAVHVIAVACMAVVTTVATTLCARHRKATRAGAPAPSLAGAARALPLARSGLWRPPEPAWVRLAVIQR